MNLNHVHLQVSDLGAAVDWFATILLVPAGFRNERMATFSFDSLIVVLDAAAQDSHATLGFQSKDCDGEFTAVMRRGAIAIEPPANKAWGVRAASFKGPGELTFEVEGPIAPA